MSDPVQRLGDMIDDYCPRCKLLLDHGIASIVNGDVIKVICRTCYTEHPYRRGEGGKKKPASSRQTLLDQVLAKAPAPVAEIEVATSPIAPKKRTLKPARYISRHQGKPPRPKR